MPSQKIEFPGSSGALLAARLDLPDTPARAYALFAHCFTCSKDTKAATYITNALVEADIAVLRFDFTGLGSSKRSCWRLRTSVRCIGRCMPRCRW